MLYKTFHDLKLSALGLGCMRLPVREGKADHLDEAAVAEMVDYALSQGVNYFDTAWGYHGGNSERVIGRALARHPRASFFLADKFPGYDLDNMDKVREIFPAQLEKCQTAHFDFYLFHNVCEKNIDAYLDPRHGILDYLLEQKAAGRIRHLGFSCHGALPVLRRFLEAHGRHMEFCQLQLNYVDWSFQNAREKTALLRERGIPVWVMEPLRGGRLARLREEEAAALRAIRPGESATALAFRFLQSLPEVTVTLSGMSDLAQLRENIAVFQTEAPLTEEEREALTALGRKMTGTVPCTACGYCTDHCTQGLDIPGLLSLYNELRFYGALPPLSRAALVPGRRPGDCVGCRHCEAVCPQQLQISQVLQDFSARLG